MYRGTTPTIVLTVKGLSEIEISKLYLTIKQFDNVIEKTLPDMQIDGDTLQADLTQQETLGLERGKVKLQLRVLSKSKTAYATKTLEVTVDDILKDGEIT